MELLLRVRTNAAGRFVVLDTYIVILQDRYIEVAIRIGCYLIAVISAVRVSKHAMQLNERKRDKRISGVEAR